MFRRETAVDDLFKLTSLPLSESIFNRVHRRVRAALVAKSEPAKDGWSPGGVRTHVPPGSRTDLYDRPLLAQSGRSLKDRLPKSGTSRLTVQQSTASPIDSGDDAG